MIGGLGKVSCHGKGTSKYEGAVLTRGVKIVGGLLGRAIKEKGGGKREGFFFVIVVVLSIVYFFDSGFAALLLPSSSLSPPPL